MSQALFVTDRLAGAFRGPFKRVRVGAADVAGMAKHSYTPGGAAADAWLLAATVWAARRLPTAAVVGLPLAATLGLRLRAHFGPVWPLVVARCDRSDPTGRIDTPPQALKVADEMLRAAALVPGTDRDDARLWLTVAVHPLAALLFSASPQANNEGIGWVRATVDTLSEGADGWVEATAGCDERVRGWLRRWGGADGRQRRSVLEAMRAALTLSEGRR